MVIWDISSLLVVTLLALKVGDHSFSKSTKVQSYN